VQKVEQKLQDFIGLVAHSIIWTETNRGKIIVSCKERRKFKEMEKNGKMDKEEPLRWPDYSSLEFMIWFLSLFLMLVHHYLGEPLL
jgi:hypothetical protein